LNEPPDSQFVSRGGLKLRHALDEFGLDVAGLRCADFGSSAGGFTDCLIQGGAAHVYSVDTSYGELAWTLRQDERVTPIERTNALHVELPEQVDLIVIDLGWTKQKHAVPAALKWLNPGGRVLTLVKPHYELNPHENPHEKDLMADGVLPDAEAERVVERVCAAMPELGARVLGCTKSPILGGAIKKRKKGKGNAEWLVLLDTIEREAPA